LILLKNPHFLFVIDANGTTGSRYKVTARQIVAEFFYPADEKTAAVSSQAGLRAAVLI
jgi:hypothetical protein